MDALQASYRDDEDGDTSEAHTPPPHPTAVQHGGAASTPTAPAVDTSGTKPELIEYNEIDEIKTCLQTPAAEDVSSGEIPLTTTAVDVSNTKSELLKINHVGGIEEGFETADASIGEKTLYGTPQTMDNDRIGQPITAAQGGESAGNPTTTAVDISGTNPDFCVNNQVHEINEGLQTAAAGVVTSGAIPLYGTLQETESGQGGGTSSNSPATAAVDRDASFVGPNQMAQPYTLRAPNLPLKPDYSEEEAPPLKKQKHLSDLLTPKLLEPVVTEMLPPAAAKAAKKSKKKNKDVWSTTSRKGKKKTKHASNSNHNSKDPTNGNDPIDKVTIAPIPRFPDKNDDGPDINICLSKVYKAEKVELSDDRLSASSTKGYRMVRATRGVTEGAWYFEIKVVHLGETGHTRLGWSTEKADLQAPVGYDGSSFGYRDVDGSKVHKASREKYGDSEGYKEGDVIGFYINLPDGGAYAPDPQKLVWHKGQKYVCAPDAKDEIPVVPGSEISYFKNGTCQGVAFTDLYGGCYYPAASMYTMPNQLACVVKFNFGPDFEMFPEDFGERPVPRSMFEVPYQSYDGKVETGTPRSSSRPRPMLKVIKEENSKIMKASEMVD